MKINKIKLICDACWLTQAELADCTGISLQRIKDISSGRVDGFKAKDMSSLVEILHLNPEWLTTGYGEIFKDGYGRDFPSARDFVSDVLDRMVKFVNPVLYQPVIDEILDLESGTAMDWIKQGKIPYSYLKKYSETQNLKLDEVIYGPAHKNEYSKKHKPAKLIAAQEHVPYEGLTKRELALLDDFRSLSDLEKDAAETMLHAVAKSKLKKA